MYYMLLYVLPLAIPSSETPSRSVSFFICRDTWGYREEGTTGKRIQKGEDTGMRGFRKWRITPDKIGIQEVALEQCEDTKMVNLSNFPLERRHIPLLKRGHFSHPQAQWISSQNLKILVFSSKRSY